MGGRLPRWRRGHLPCDICWASLFRYRISAIWYLGDRHRRSRKRAWQEFCASHDLALFCVGSALRVIAVHPERRTPKTWEKRFTYKMRVIRSFMVSFALCVAVLTSAQDLSQTAEQSDVSQVLKASGTLFIREIHSLADVETVAGASIRCKVVIVRVLEPLAALSKEDTTTVGLQFSLKEEYSERSAYVDIEEAEGLLASLRVILSEGMAILKSPLVDGIDQTNRSAEIHYTTKEKISLGAFDYRGNLRFALKISSLADWALLTPNGTDTLASNLSLVADIARIAQMQ